jgi:hypothetical protein
MDSPKPDLPSPESYETPAPLSTRDLGPPPPGYGRYADFDRAVPNGAYGGTAGNSTSGPPRRNLDEVLCFKVCYPVPCLCECSNATTSLLSAERKGTMQTIAAIATSQGIVEVLSDEGDMVQERTISNTCMIHGQYINVKLFYYLYRR